MHPVELVILDCDGVLVDSEPIAIRVEQRFLAELGWPISAEELVDRFLGVPADVFHRAVAERLGLPDDWHDAYEQVYLDAFRRELEPVDGVVEALDAIDLPTVVASSGTHEKMRFTLGHTGLLERFEGRIVSTSEVPRGKPHPGVFLLAAERMRTSPERCVVVEDSPNGVTAGIAAGMRVLGYAGGLTPAERLQHATATFTDMRELPGLVERMRSTAA